jgi:Tol biopolymer transport system component
MHSRIKKIIKIIFLLLCFSTNLYAQYFGQNKVMYDRFDFDIYETPHFQIYNYLNNDSIKIDLGQQAERWYLRHASIFHDTLKESPIILYNNKADFKQTTVISGLIGVGTGGVTEGFRSRVMIPIMTSNKETDHVLGHEMVHVFQYNLIRENDSLSMQSLMYTPLWMIEGMAEFFSIGSRDNRTAMWMRDAVIHDDIPTIRDLTRKQYEYFPYRYGHALLAYLSGVWGDEAIQPLLYNTFKFGPERALDTLFHFSSDSISKYWAKSLKDYYTPLLKDTVAAIGQKMFSTENAGSINLSPVLSNDGKYIIFLADKNVITIDILLAKTKTKEILTKLSSNVRKSHIDDFNYIESSGAWSPQGNKYVLTTFTKGANNLLLVSISENKIKTLKEIKIKGIDAFSNPEWSPNGESILFTGLVDGQSDLFLYNIKAKTIKQLTNDLYSDLQASWSVNGNNIAFISERGDDTNLGKQIYGNYRLCILNTENNKIKTFNFLEKANIYSPQYSALDTSIFFLSNADGFRNIYRYNFDTQKIVKLTKFATGVTGITDLAPAYSVARETGEIAYTLFENDKYNIYYAKPEEFLNIPVNPKETNFEAELLPPGKTRLYDIVDNNLKVHPSKAVDSFNNAPYKSKFQLEYLGSSGFGVGANQYGTVAAGGVSALFGDMLKYHQIFTTIQVNGEIYDIGGQVAYINQKSRYNWGASLSHIPYRSSFWDYKQDSLQQDDGYLIVDNYVIEQMRVFQDMASIFGMLPLSSKLRFEGGVSFAHYGFRVDSINTYYSLGGARLGENKQQIDAPNSYSLGKTYLAFVGDNSYNGITSPLSGYRYRFQVDKMFSELHNWNILLDYRKYFFKKPFSFAFRTIHYGRYFGSTDMLYPLFIGNNYYIRGYTYNTFNKIDLSKENRLNINSLAGDKILLANTEIRFPFTGPERLSLIKSDYFYSDLVLFFDGGIAWKNDFPWEDESNIKLSWTPIEGARIPVFSTGLSLRINLFGYAILEPYIAMPLQIKEVPYVFGFSISGGGW